MPADRSHVEQNNRERSRMHALVEQLGEQRLAQAVNESWTVDAVLGHIAFWDGRALFRANRLRDGLPFSPSDTEPEDVDWINDATRPLIHAIPPVEAARLALRVADETDELLAALPPELVARTYPDDPESPLNRVRADHRGEHLDEIESALAGAEGASRGQSSA